jgi:ADP-heptose:LPS heptosyltransferase
MRILVVRAGALGDTLMATPLLPALAARHPGASIDVLASAVAAPLLSNNPHVSSVFPLRWRNLPLGLSVEKLALIRRLRAAAYDLAIVLEHANRYWSLVRHAEPARILGFGEVRFDPALHSSANNLRAAGFDDWAARDLSPQVFLDDRDLSEARQAMGSLDASSGVIGLHVGYGPVGRKRRNQDTRLRGWKLENFVEVGRRLALDGCRIVLTGSREDRDAVSIVARDLPPRSVLNLAGALSVRGLAAAISRMSALVSVDSGPAHVAAGVGTPLVVLWGPGILEQTRPIGRAAPVTILRHPPPCAPCYGTPLMKTCQRNVCMEAITPDEVVSTLLSLLRPRA